MPKKKNKRIRRSGNISRAEFEKCTYSIIDIAMEQLGLTGLTVEHGGVGAETFYIGSEPIRSLLKNNELFKGMLEAISYYMMCCGLYVLKVDRSGGGLCITISKERREAAAFNCLSHERFNSLTSFTPESGVIPAYGVC